MREGALAPDGALELLDALASLSLGAAGAV